MSKEFDDLKIAVGDIVTVAKRAEVTMDTIKTKLDTAITNAGTIENPAALTELSAELGAESKSMADAIARDTPA